MFKIACIAVVSAVAGLIGMVGYVIAVSDDLYDPPTYERG